MKQCGISIFNRSSRMYGLRCVIWVRNYSLRHVPASTLYDLNYKKKNVRYITIFFFFPLIVCRYAGFSVMWSILRVLHIGIVLITLGKSPMRTG